MCPVGAGSDTLVAPEHLGQRLSNKLTRYALSGRFFGPSDHLALMTRKVEPGAILSRIRHLH